MTKMVSGGRRRVHYTFPDEGEMVEEYDLQTDELVVRKRRGKTVLGAVGAWEFEVGEAPERHTVANEMMQASSSNPIFTRKDRPHCFEWRIRNLPYPKPTYSVTVDAESRQLVVRTANKKYYKRITIEDLDRARLPLEEAPLSIEDLDRARLPIEEAPLSWTHENNTLVIQYKKPAAILQREKEAKIERLSAPDAVQEAPDGQECKQQ